MLFTVLDGVLYLVGLVLLIMPGDAIPYYDGDNQTVRVMKHLVGLVVFAVATIRIHRVIKEDAGIGFVLASAVLILLISLFKTWKAKR
ncbi:MAG: hypothetical protein ABEK50_04705 [bacterium]